jgi:hypothetical protein
LVAAIVLTAYVGGDSLAHDSWISRGNHRNAAGEWCCGAGDCFIVPKERVMMTGEGYVVPRPACRRWAAIPRGGAIQRSSAVARRRVLALPASERFAPLFLRTAAFDVIPAGRDGVARFGRSRIISGSVEDRRNSSQYSAQAPLPGKSLNFCVKPH